MKMPPWMRGTPGLVIASIIVVCGCGRTALELTAPGGASDAGPLSACDSTSCTGCCSTTGQCLAGTMASACGSGGTACAPCPVTATCSGGMCKASNVVLFGGIDMNSTRLNDTWTFDGSSWTQVSVSNAPPARADATMATLGHEVVLFGGIDYVDSIGTIFLSDTWTFNGTSWTQVSVSNPPLARWGAVMATLGSEVVLFGGSDANNHGLSDTWTFDGSTWTQVSVSRAPPMRSGAAMATLDTEVVLFGGEGTNGPLNDTWTFDGATWTQVTVSRAPPGRVSASLATLGNEVVLFGDDYPIDTWAFDGTDWTQVSVSNSPPGRSDATMATLGNELVLFGGWANRPLGDSWTFDGTSWTQVSVTSPVSARYLATMAALP